VTEVPEHLIKRSIAAKEKARARGENVPVNELERRYLERHNLEIPVTPKPQRGYVPEHLLARSRARRSAIEQRAGDGDILSSLGNGPEGSIDPFERGYDNPIEGLESEDIDLVVEMGHGGGVCSRRVNELVASMEDFQAADTQIEISNWMEASFSNVVTKNVPKGAVRKFFRALLAEPELELFQSIGRPIIIEDITLEVYFGYKNNEIGFAFDSTFVPLISLVDNRQSTDLSQCSYAVLNSTLFNSIIGDVITAKRDEQEIVMAAKDMSKGDGFIAGAQLLDIFAKAFSIINTAIVSRYIEELFDLFSVKEAIYSYLNLSPETSYKLETEVRDKVRTICALNSMLPEFKQKYVATRFHDRPGKSRDLDEIFSIEALGDGSFTITRQLSVTHGHVGNATPIYVAEFSPRIGEVKETFYRPRENDDTSTIPNSCVLDPTVLEFLEAMIMDINDTLSQYNHAVDAPTSLQGRPLLPRRL